MLPFCLHFLENVGLLLAVNKTILLDFHCINQNLYSLPKGASHCAFKRVTCGDGVTVKFLPRFSRVLHFVMKDPHTKLSLFCVWTCGIFLCDFSRQSNERYTVGILQEQISQLVLTQLDTRYKFLTALLASHKTNSPLCTLSCYMSIYTHPGYN